MINLNHLLLCQSFFPTGFAFLPWLLVSTFEKLTVSSLDCIIAANSNYLMPTSTKTHVIFLETTNTIELRPEIRAFHPAS